MKKEEILYLDTPGPHNTDIVVQAVRSYVATHRIKYVVVASTTGETAVKFAEGLGGMARLIVVTHHTGFRQEGVQSFDVAARELLAQRGIRVITQSHVLSGVERSISRRLGGVSRVEAIAEALRSLLGHGLKVCVEIAVMAADAGAIPIEEVVAVGGTGSGADTAVVIRPAHMNNLFDAHVQQIIVFPLGHIR
ncbi:MAG: pyruvate kinase alpha/beta domain-containing protein [Halobacteriota archaeon]